MAGNIDTSTEAVERVRRLLRHPDGVWRAHGEEADEMLGAIAAERDALRQQMQIATTEQWHVGFAAGQADRDRLAAALAQARKEVMEEAAQIADEHRTAAKRSATEEWEYSVSAAVRGRIDARAYEAERIAAAIRAKAQEVKS